MADATERSVADISEVLLRPDVQKALTDVLNNLPKLGPVIALASKGAEAAIAAISDPDLMGGLEEAVLDTVKPAQAKARECISIFKEAKLRAERDRSYIGVFGLLKLLKDPHVQYALHFIQAVMDEASERKAGITPPPHRGQ